MLSLVSFAVAAATSPPPLQPFGKWTVNYEKDMCFVMREFGPSDNTTIFALRPGILMDDGSQTLYVLAADTGGRGTLRGQAVVTLVPSGLQKTVDYFSWVPKDEKRRAYQMHGDAEFITALGKSTGVSLTVGKRVFSFATGNVQPVLNALAKCNINLLQSWGVDPEARAKLPKGVDMARWFLPDAYPAAAMRRNAQGRTVVVLNVSPDGKPTSCRVVVSADPELDKASCDVMMRNGTFEKVTGPPNRSAVVGFTWAIPGH